MSNSRVQINKRRPSLRLRVPIYHQDNIRKLALFFLAIKAWKAPLPLKLPIYDQSKPPRNATLCNEAEDCSYCVELHNRKEFSYPLIVCRPYLWTMEISHLIMMLGERIARSEQDPPSASRATGETSSLLPIKKIDEIIASDIEAVLRHEKISEEDYNELPTFRKKLEAAKEKLDGIEGFDPEMGYKLQLVSEEMRDCYLCGGWGIFSLGILPR